LRSSPGRLHSFRVLPRGTPAKIAIIADDIRVP
jgi:hypothetical protein